MTNPLIFELRAWCHTVLPFYAECIFTNNTCILLPYFQCLPLFISKFCLLCLFFFPFLFLAPSFPSLRLAQLQLLFFSSLGSFKKIYTCVVWLCVAFYLLMFLEFTKRSLRHTVSLRHAATHPYLNSFKQIPLHSKPKPCLY